MVRVLGAALAAGACAWMGFYRAACLKKQVLGLEGVESDFTLLLQRLELGGMMPDLMEDMARKSGSPARVIFAECARQLSGTDRETFSGVWRRAVERCSDLGEETRFLLFPLGETLGQCTLEDQRQALRAICGQIAHLRRREEETMRSKGRVYRALGVSGGSFLVILLL